MVCCSAKVEQHPGKVLSSAESADSGWKMWCINVSTFMLSAIDCSRYSCVVSRC